MDTLLNHARQDIANFLYETHELCCNEKDLQLQKGFERVTHGIALFLTNDSLYHKPKSRDRVCVYDNFRLCEGIADME